VLQSWLIVLKLVILALLARLRWIVIHRYYPESKVY
jgi:hypothetical protein